MSTKCQACGVWRKNGKCSCPSEKDLERKSERELEDERKEEERDKQWDDVSI